MFIKINEHERAFSLFENNLIHLLHFFSCSHSPALYIRKDFFFSPKQCIFWWVEWESKKYILIGCSVFLFIYLFSKSTKIYTHRNFNKQKFSYPLKFPKNPATGPWPEKYSNKWNWRKKKKKKKKRPGLVVPVLNLGSGCGSGSWRGSYLGHHVEWGP